MNAQFIRSVISDKILQTFLKTDNLTDFDQDLVVEAIDVGYGYTKYTTGIDEQGNVTCDLFPSIAAHSPQDNLSGGFFVSRDTKVIEIGGTPWEVGPDVADVANKSEVRALHDGFIKSEQWRALFFGALAYMDKKVIDFLVLGLPVSNMAMADEMKEIAIGDHIINGETYTIKDVLVVPQPLGALYNHAIRSDNFERFSKTNTLIIDPGYLTFDFLVTKGFSVNGNRSGARPGGMSNILNAIAESVSRELGDTYDDFDEIDAALDLKNYGGVQAKRPVHIYGQEIDLVPHLQSTKTVIENSMNFMINKTGDSKDISQIIMAGGPNKIFDRSIKKQFERHDKQGNIKTLPEGIFANATGFLLWGMMVAYGNAMKEAQKAGKSKAKAA